MQPLHLTLPISVEARKIATQFQLQQSNPQKSQQVYRNTIAVYLVKFYLESLGWKTDLSSSYSCIPLMQSMMNVADLQVKDYGKLECLAVFPEIETIHIPQELWLDRIGYVILELSQSATEAKLLGFLKHVSTEEISINQLFPVYELPSYLTSNKPLVKLSQWLDNIFVAGWGIAEELIDTQELTFAFRAAQMSTENTIKATKLIDLGIDLGHQSVALLMALTPVEDGKIGIRVQLHPIGKEIYLPPNIKLAMLSESGENIQKVEARGQDNYIQLKWFKALPGKYFSLHVSIQGLSWVENFVI